MIFLRLFIRPIGLTMSCGGEDGSNIFAVNNGRTVEIMGSGNSISSSITTTPSGHSRVDGHLKAGDLRVDGQLETQTELRDQRGAVDKFTGPGERLRVEARRGDRRRR